MKINTFFIAVIIFSGLFSSGQEDNLKKIMVLKNNNPVLNFQYQYLGFPDSVNTPELAGLKKYVLSKLSLKVHSDPEIFFELMDWVRKQWKHNGWNAAPDTLTSLDILKNAREDGQEYRCVEYGIVLNDILKSFGYPARIIGLKNANVAYGGAGMGHVATEVWSNKYQKWIFLDPQFGIYAKYAGKPLNIFDIYRLKKKNKFDEIEFIDAGTNLPGKNYGKDFLSNYLGYMDISLKRNGLSYSLVLKMEGENEYLTFQGFPAGNVIFTADADDLYFSINQTMVLIGFTEKEKDRCMKKYSELNIRSAKNFNKNMALFAAQPDFELTFDNNMPWFDHYIVKINDSLVPVRNGKCHIHLKNGLNTLEAVAVNQSDIEGIPTVINIKYD